MHRRIKLLLKLVDTSALISVNKHREDQIFQDGLLLELFFLLSITSQTEEEPQIFVNLLAH